MFRLCASLILGLSCANLAIAESIDINIEDKGDHFVFWSKYGIPNATLSSDGSLVAVAKLPIGNFVRIISLEKKEEICSCFGGMRVTTFTFSPDGKRLILAYESFDQTETKIDTYDIKSKEVVRSLSLPVDQWVSHIVVSDDNTKMGAFVSGKKRSGMVFYDFDQEEDEIFTGDGTSSVVFINKNKQMITGSGTSILISNLDFNFSDKGKLTTHGGSVNSLQLTPDAKRLIVGTCRTKVSAIQIEENKLVTMKANKSMLESVGVYSSERVVTGGTDGKVRIWDVKTGEQVGSFDALSKMITVLHCAPNKLILTIGEDRVVRIWKGDKIKALGK